MATGSEDENKVLIGQMRKFDIDLRTITAIRPLFALRSMHAQGYLLAATDADKAKELRGIEFCNIEICQILLIPKELL